LGDTGIDERRKLKKMSNKDEDMRMRDRIGSNSTVL